MGGILEVEKLRQKKEVAKGSRVRVRARSERYNIVKDSEGIRKWTKGI